MKDPIFIFALPRSGSTLFMRLLAQSQDVDGKPVSSNGELDILWQVVEIYRALVVADQRNSTTGDLEKVFRPLQFQGDLESALISLRKCFLSICTKDLNSTCSIKTVNFGLTDRFSELLNGLKSVFPSSKFVFHTRDVNDVLKSMSKHPWWETDEESRRNRINRQVANYINALDSNTDHVKSEYEDLLDYVKFSTVIGKLGLTITEERFTTVLGKILKR